MTQSVLITLCILLLLAYVFDLSATWTRIPSVILLLLVGWLVRQGTDALHIVVPDLQPVLPILGTIGLILIVLEGSLELEVRRSKVPMVMKSVWVALLPMMLLSAALSWSLSAYEGLTFREGLLNAIPLAIISSSIAIPSAHTLRADKREFILYESSLSDIFGVVLFNLVLINETFGWGVAGNFFLDLLLMLVITVLTTAGLAYLLSKINHRIKFVPLILMIILIYSLAKDLHLPALILILFMGLFLANLEQIKEHRLVRGLKPDALIREVQKFRELTTEITFLFRALFFLLFGYLIETHELLNAETLLVAILICAGIFILRYLFLRLFRIPVVPVLFYAPRGLITILLFLSVPIQLASGVINRSLILQVILLTALVMMAGTMIHGGKGVKGSTKKKERI